MCAAGALIGWRMHRYRKKLHITREKVEEEAQQQKEMVEGDLFGGKHADAVVQGNPLFASQQGGTAETKNAMMQAELRAVEEEQRKQGLTIDHGPSSRFKHESNV